MSGRLKPAKARKRKGQNANEEWSTDAILGDIDDEQAPPQKIPRMRLVPLNPRPATSNDGTSTLPLQQSPPPPLPQSSNMSDPCVCLGDSHVDVQPGDTLPPEDNDAHAASEEPTVDVAKSKEGGKQKKKKKAKANNTIVS